MRIHPRVLHHTEVVGDISDRWSMYDGCGILLYPRRYGGQSLVVNEAMARGLAVIMGDGSPNLDWPIAAVPVRPGGTVRTPGGMVQMQMVLTQPMTELITVLTTQPDLLETYQTKSIAWARDNAWSVWEPEIRRLLEDAAS
jgi:hypothetical protein